MIDGGDLCGHDFYVARPHMAHQDDQSSSKQKAKERFAIKNKAIPIRWDQCQIQANAKGLDWCWIGAEGGNCFALPVPVCPTAPRASDGRNKERETLL